MKKVLVIGASTNPTRYSNRVVRLLKRKGYQAIPFGIREGDIDGIPIHTALPETEDLHAISLYLNPNRQEAYYDYILQQKPKHLIFNPGTENPKLFMMAKEAGIKPLYACNLAMLSIGNFPE